MSRYLVPCLVLFSLVPSPSLAAPPPPAPAAGSPAGGAAAAASLAYRAFLAQVGQSNLDLIAQRANVPIADAQIAVAKIFPDPTLTLGLAAIDISGKGAPTATTVGVSYTVELGGKRSARIAAAVSGLTQANADLEDFFRTLRGAATNGYIDCLYTRLILERKQQTLKGLENLVSVNEERLRAGDVGKVALTQSRVEAQRFRGEVLGAEADVDAADLALKGFLGEAGKAAAAEPAPTGSLKIPPRSFNVEALIAQAKANRPDLASKIKAAEVAAARADLARANRWVDVTLNVGWQHNLAGSGPFIAPSYDSLGATVSVPIPFSKVYRGELDAALATQAQGRTLVQATQLKIDVEVRQAYARYQAAVNKLSLYTGGLLTDADQVLESMLYNYQRGGATLLEVLEAQRTVNEVYIAFYDALAEHARALVSLEQAAGIWDIDF